MRYRRVRIDGGTYFFTVVTDRRAPILCTPSSRKFLREAIQACQAEYPFEMSAVVLLPEHLHALWVLPSGDCDFSKRWAIIKRTFTESYLANGGREQRVTKGRQRQGRRGVWQPRFWEHMIRDETDYERHFDYIHYNPVKHGHVTRPQDWKWSTFHRWVGEGVYPIDWACATDDKWSFKEIVDVVGE